MFFFSLCLLFGFGGFFPLNPQLSWQKEHSHISLFFLPFIALGRRLWTVFGSSRYKSPVFHLFCAEVLGPLCLLRVSVLLQKSEK